MGVERIVQAIAVTAELTGSVLSPAAQAQMAKDLLDYPEDAALRALDRFRRESRGRLTLAGVIELIDQEDGRPSADEAWAMCPRGEGDSVFWNDEIQAALGVARPVLESGDKVGARMAFRDAYERIVRDARAARRRPQWSLSLGWDKAGRVEAVQRAVQAGLIDRAAADRMLPAPGDSPVAALLDGRNPLPLLGDASADDRDTALRGIERCRAVLEESARRNAEDERRREETAKAARAALEAQRARQLAAADEKMRRGES